MLLLCGMLPLIRVATDVSLRCTRFSIDYYWLGTLVYQVPEMLIFPFFLMFILRHDLI